MLDCELLSSQTQLENCDTRAYKTVFFFNLLHLSYCSGFNNLSNLKEHKRTHATDKTFTCDQCGKSFNTHRKLLKHKARHAGEKPHSCATCGKEQSLSCWKYYSRWFHWRHICIKHCSGTKTNSRSIIVLIIDQKVSFLSRNAKHLMVPASHLPGFSAPLILTCMSTRISLVLDFWLDKTCILMTWPWALLTDNGHFSLFSGIF